MLRKEGDNIFLKGSPVLDFSGLTKDFKSTWFSAEVPSTKGDDFLNITSKSLKTIKLLLYAANIDAEG